MKDLTNDECLDWINNKILPLTCDLSAWFHSQNLSGTDVRFVLCAYLGALAAANTDSVEERAAFNAEHIQLMEVFGKQYNKPGPRIVGTLQ